MAEQVLTGLLVAAEAALTGRGIPPLSNGGGRLLICERGGGRIRWRRELAGLGW